MMMNNNSFIFNNLLYQIYLIRLHRKGGIVRWVCPIEFKLNWMEKQMCHKETNVGGRVAIKEDVSFINNFKSSPNETVVKTY